MSETEAYTMPDDDAPPPPKVKASELNYISESLRPLALPIASLSPDPANARLHGEKNLDSIKASLHKFGQRKPVVVQKKGMIVRAGNGTMAAAKSLGWTHLACNVIDEDSTDATSFAIADNRTAELAEWDDEILASLLQSLPEDAQVAAGFDENDLSELLSSLTPEVVEDVVPEPPVAPVSRLGDLWLCGEHRVLCGDSTKAEAVGRLMGGEKASICLTDPPYGLGDTSSDKNNYAEYEDTKANLLKTISGFFPLAKSLCDTVVFTPGNGNTSHYENPTWTMAWFTPAGIGRGPWGFCCWQPILCYGKDPKLANGDGCHPDAIVHTESSEDFGHPCTKPIKFWCWLMERTSSRGDLVYEPFSGSGTTLIAAEQLGRKCYGMEISPQYVDVIVKRWQTLTGKQATLESTGATFDQTAQDREATA